VPPPVVFAIDDAYREPLLVALSSLRSSNPRLAGDLDVIVIHESLAPAAQDEILACADRLGLNLEIRRAVLPDLPYNTEFGGARANYLRLAIPHTIDSSDRAVYIDADVVVTGEISGLLDAELGGRPIGAVRDAINPTLATGRALPAWRRLGLDGNREYFNSGVMVLDLAACARDGIFGRALDAVATHGPDLRLWDQDALNLAAADRWCRLESKWNTIPLSALLRTPWVRYAAEQVMPAAQLIAAERDAAIMHYVSPSKPWRGLLPSGPANDLYQSHRASLELLMHGRSPEE
jgi:lipopolysaccharide biosynthesis glycosyltransferase